MSKEEKSWILYDWACSAYTMVVLTLIFPLFFKGVIASDLPNSTSTAYFGYANSFASLIIALLAPFLGMIADFKNRKKKFFTFFFSMGVFFTLGLAFIGKGDISTALIIFILSVIGYSGANIFYDSFLVDTTTKDRMDDVSSHGFAWGYIGGVLLFIMAFAVISMAPKLGLSTEVATKISFGMTAIWWVVFTIPMLRNVKQKHYIEPKKEIFKYTFGKMKSIFSTVRGNKPAFMFLIAYFFYIDGVSTIIKMSSSYAYDLGIGSKTIMIIFIVIQFLAFPCSILFAVLAKKFSPKKILLLGIAVYSFISIFAFFMTTELHFWIMAILVAFAQGGIQGLSRSYFGKLIPKENASEFFGLYNIFGRFAAILGPFLVGFLSYVTGNSKNGVLALIVLFIVGAILLIRVPEDVNSIA